MWHPTHPCVRLTGRLPHAAAQITNGSEGKHRWSIPLPRPNQFVRGCEIRTRQFFTALDEAFRVAQGGNLARHKQVSGASGREWPVAVNPLWHWAQISMLFGIQMLRRSDELPARTSDGADVRGGGSMTALSPHTA